MHSVPRPADSGKPPDLEKLVEQFAEWGRLRASPKWAHRNALLLRDFIEAQHIRQAGDITIPAIEEYLLAMQAKGRAAKTVNNHRAAISRFCCFLEGRGFLQDNPCRGVPMMRLTKRAPIFLTKQEVKRALAIAREYDVYCEVCLALNTGLRMSELRFLQWEDIDFRRRALLVRKSKSNRPRTVWLNKMALQALKKQRQRYGRADYVFPGGHGRRAGKPVWDRNQPRGENWWSKTALEPLQRELPTFQTLPPGHIGRKWHLLRHSFASRAVQAGVSIYKVSQWLGHSDVKTTMIYAHLSPDYDPDIERVC